MTSVETIGERICRERRALGMTQRGLGNQVAVGAPYISKIERGRENPSDDLLRRFAEVFTRDVDELFIVARRLPETMIEQFAADPARALAFLRRWKPR